MDVTLGFKQRMIAGMKEVLPDLLVDVKYAATDRWRKKAEAVFDDEERLCLWYPKKDEKKSAHSAKRAGKRKARRNHLGKS